MKLKIWDIREEELYNFIQLVDGYHGIWNSNKSWMQDENSCTVQITLYCYLISNGTLYVENQKLKSADDGHSVLIDFMEQFFEGKCIVNFTDLFFLNEIKQAFCGGNLAQCTRMLASGKIGFHGYCEIKKTEIHFRRKGIYDPHFRFYGLYRRFLFPKMT